MTTIIESFRRAAAVLIVAVCTTQGSQAAGLMTPAGGKLPQLDIRQHHVDVTIQDGYAITRCC